MASGKITKRSVDALKPGVRDVFLWDVNRKGFGIKRTPSGKLTYILQYRMHGGRSDKIKRYTIGSHGIWTPALAGKEAEKLLIMIAQGIDPVAEAARVRTEAITLAFSSYADRFMDQYVKINWPRAHKFPATALRLHIKPAFGDTPLPQIDARRITRLFDDLPAEKPGLRRNVFVVLRRLFRWAKGRGDIVMNPLEGFEAPLPVPARDRVLSDEELRCLWLASYNLGRPFGSFVRLLLLTGQRRSEVAGIQWPELDRKNRQWLLPSNRAKNSTEMLIPLPEATITEIDALAGGEDWPRRGYLLTNTGKTPISGFSKAKIALDIEMLRIFQEDDAKVELKPWRFHDLRRSMATTMQRMRISGDVIEACENRIAGHSKPGSARIYQRHNYEPEKRDAFDRWTLFITGLAI